MKFWPTLIIASPYQGVKGKKLKTFSRTMLPAFIVPNPKPRIEIFESEGGPGAISY